MKFAVAFLLALAVVTQAGATSQPRLDGWLTFGGNVSRTGATPAGVSTKGLVPRWFREVDGMTTVQPLVVRNTPRAGQTTAFVATVHGRVSAYAPSGYVRWQRNLGAAPNSCPQLDEYGVEGTPVVDPATRALYVADGFGLLHSLDLVTGRDRPGWPVRLYDDPGAELVWGALTLVRGSVYVGTGSYCDRPMVGKLIRVELSSRRVSSWEAVPKALGGGGSIWGWGGAAYSAARDALFVVTGNAFARDESAGYGEHLVELSRDLDVLAADHPADVVGTDDFDFAGSPVIVDRAGCGELVAALNKNGRVYLWRTDDVSGGAVASVAVQSPSLEQPLLTQLAYAPSTHSLYAVTFTSLVRIAIDGCDEPRIAWAKRFPRVTLQGSPTVAGPTVWLALSGSPGRLRGYDAATGALRYDRALGGISFAPPTLIGGWLLEGAAHGLSAGKTASSAPGAGASGVRAYTSWADKRAGWQSRESGVYATEDGGKTWRRIYPTYAQRVLRLSSLRGVISVGAGPVPCDCRQRQLWTADGGKSWHETRALGARFTGTPSELYTWSGEELRRASWPPARSAHVATFPQAVADAAVVPGGLAALLTSAGRGYDNLARLALVQGDAVSSVTLPETPGRVEARTLTVMWPQVVVRTSVFTDTGRKVVRWRSPNGGRSWAAD